LAERIKLEIKTGHLATTAINSFELLSGAKDTAERDKVSQLWGADRARRDPGGQRARSGDPA